MIPYVLTVTPEGLTLVPKGKRKGYSLAWDAFISGEGRTGNALNASLMVARQVRRIEPRRIPAHPEAPQAYSQAVTLDGARKAARRKKLELELAAVARRFFCIASSRSRVRPGPRQNPSPWHR